MDPEYPLPSDLPPPEYYDQLYNANQFYWLSWVYTAIWLVYGAFWLWMLFDCIRNEPDKYLWLLILVFIPLGTFIYFVLRVATRLDVPRPMFVIRWQRQRELWAAEAAARNIGNPYQFVALGDLLREFREPARAAEAYARALAKEPKNAQALWGLSQVEMERKEYPSCRGHLETLLAIDPHFKFGEAYLAYARVLLALGDKPAAREHLAGGIKRWSYPEAHVLLATLLLEDGQKDAARGHLETVVIDMRAAPSYSYRRNRQWVKKAKGLLRGLPA